MKKTLALLMSGIMILSSCGKTETGPDFRQINWGMSFDEVKESEKGLPNSLALANEMLMYDVKLFGHDWILAYLIDENGVTGASYSTEGAIAEISLVDRIKSEYTEVYGEPVSDEQIWKEDIDKSLYPDLIKAVNFGYLVLLTQWETDSTIINLKLSGRKDGNLTVFYISKDYLITDDNI